MHKEALYLYGFCKGAKLPLTLKAITYATKLHEGQYRDGGEDYIKHPLEVCRRLINNGIKDDITLVASILHDLVEDGKATLEEIKEMFDEEIAHLVDLLSKRKDEPLEDYYKRISQDIRAIIIKAVDRVCNVSDMVEIFTTKRLKRYVEETEEHVLPMMKTARRIYLDYSDALVAIRDNINGVLKPVKEVIRLEEKMNETQEVKNRKKETGIRENCEEAIRTNYRQSQGSPAFIPLDDVVPKINPTS